MSGTNVTKIASASVPPSDDGHVALAAGRSVAMRMWRDEQPDAGKPSATRTYETVGYVLGGRAELRIGDTVVTLEAGDSWVVPSGMPHTYRILETFSAVEATSPPAP